MFREPSRRDENIPCASRERERESKPRFLEDDESQVGDR